MEKKFIINIAPISNAHVCTITEVNSDGTRKPAEKATLTDAQVAAITNIIKPEE